MVLNVQKLERLRLRRNNQKEPLEALFDYAYVTIVTISFMKIATYNVRNLYDPGTFIDDEAGEPVKEALFKERISYFVEYLQKLNLDIVCLQEIGGEIGVSTIGDTLGYHYFFAKPNKRGIRMAVLYKKDLSMDVSCESVSLGDLVIPDILEEGDTKNLPPVAQRRDILTIDINDYNGKPLRIVTFHLKSNLPTYLNGEVNVDDENVDTDARFRSVFYKTLELKGLRLYATKSLKEGREIMFMGDFNEDKNSSVLSILKSSQKEEFILNDVLVGYEGNRTTHFHRGNGLTFDTMLVSNWVKSRVTKVMVENQELKDCSTLPPGAIEYEVQSDHALVWVEI